MFTQADKHVGPNDVVYGRPRALPTVLLCHATAAFCGRFWIANTWDEYEQAQTGRQLHETLCDSLPKLEVPR
jgi:hypothetical protein